MLADWLLLHKSISRALGITKAKEVKKRIMTTVKAMLGLLVPFYYLTSGTTSLCAFRSPAVVGVGNISS